jgi:protease I
MAILMVVAPKDFRDEEFLEPKKLFSAAEAQVTVASKGTDEAVGKLGAAVKVDKDLSEVSAADFDAVVFVGGPGSAVYFDDPTALKLAKEAHEAGRVVGAICIAPSILANAGLLNGRSATAFPSEEQNLREKGADYTGEPVTKDGKIITANGSQAATSFAKEILGVLEPSS